jgi:hypothetical protein
MPTYRLIYRFPVDQLADLVQEVAFAGAVAYIKT